MQYYLKDKKRIVEKKKKDCEGYQGRLWGQGVYKDLSQDGRDRLLRK